MPLSRWLRRRGIVLPAVVLLGCLSPSAPAAAAVSNATAAISAGDTRAIGDIHVHVEGSDRLAVDAALFVRSLSAVGTVGLGPRGSADATLARWQWPLPGPHRVTDRFDGPVQPWLRGHRGVDLTGYDGLPVLAVTGGVVAYSGTINGVRIVSVQHSDGLRSTYQPVAGGLQKGRSVVAGQRLGYLETTGSHCWPGACLHLGARRGTTYLDPLLLLGAWEVSLLPTA